MSGWMDRSRELLQTWFGRPQVEPGTEPRNEPAVGEVLSGRYRLDERLGAGTGGAVFRARDLVLEMDVAVKVLMLDGLYKDPSVAALADLRAEARATLQLAHPNIVRVHTYERDGDWEYLVMELVRGTDASRLRHRYLDKRIPVERVLEIGIAALDALAWAHDRGIVHNDVKPGNILVGDDEAVKVCDFGLAALRERRQPSGVVVGSPVYMPPERIRGEAGDARSDIYSMGASLYAMVTGRAPFGGRPTRAMLGHLNEPVPLGDMPADLERILRRSMAKEPSDRFESAGAMRDALSRFLADWRRPRSEPIAAGSATQPLDPLQAAPRPERAVPAAAARQPAMARISARRVRIRGVDVEVRPFLLDVEPVTNEAWREWIAATGATPPAHWLGDRPPRGRERHPVVGVSLDEARAFAAWRGARLPTEAEWTSVVRGADGRRAFPWGDRCLGGAGCQCPRSGADGTSAVGGRPDGATPEGVRDLLGNVWEWVEPDPRLPPPEPGRAPALGGSFKQACPVPGEIPRVELAENKTYLYLGFRCAADEGNA